MDCLFCKLRDQNAGKFVFEDDRAFVMRDINPQAPTHLLVLPKTHLAGPSAVKTVADEALVGHVIAIAAKVAEEHGIAESGYRLVINCNAHGGQTVFHLHVHLIGGRQLTWPPG